MKRPAQLPRRLTRSRRARLRLELLESRDTPTVFLEIDPNDTLDIAQALGELGTQGSVEVLGHVGGYSGPADVDWYGFTLDHTAAVVFTVGGNRAGNPVLSLYNSDPFDFGDPFDPVHNRQLGQTPDGSDRLEFVLGAGTYFAAVSGSGNRYFHPYLAGSGSAGVEGDYTLTVQATGLPQPDTQLAGASK